jgi:hypothetical protein
MKKIRGKFGISDNIDDYIEGELSISDSGSINLDVFGIFEKKQYNYNHDKVGYNIIKGYGYDGRYYELIDAQQYGLNLKINAFNQDLVKFFSCQLITNALNNFDDVNKIIAKIDKLNQWAADTDIVTNRNIKPFEIKLYEKKIWEYNFNGCIYSISSHVLTEEIENICFNANYSYTLCITIEEDKPFYSYIDYYINKIGDFSNIVELLTNQSVNCNSIEIKQNGRLSGGNLYYNGLCETTEKTTKLADRQEFVYLHLIKDIMGDILKTYTDKIENIRAVVEFISFGIKSYQEKNYDIISLLKECATAIECFMRNNRGDINKEEDESDYDERFNRIVDGLSNEDKKWVEDKLRFANEISFNKQIKLLIKEFEDSFIRVGEKIFTEKDKTKKIIRKFVATRNFYTHYDNKSRDDIMDEEEILWFCIFMKELLRVMLLKEIGVPVDIIDKTLYDNCNLLFWGKRVFAD